MLDEGDAQNLDYDRQIAKRLSEPEAISIWNVLIKDTADQPQLSCECHESLWMVELFFKVPQKQTLILRKYRIEQIYHQQKSLEGNILSILVLHNQIWVRQSHSTLIIILILHRKNVKNFIEQLPVMYKQLNRAICGEHAHFTKHSVGILQAQFAWLLNAENVVNHRNCAKLIAEEVCLDCDHFRLAHTEHPCLYFWVVSVGACTLDHLHQLMVFKLEHSRSMLSVGQYHSLLLAVKRLHCNVSRFECEGLRVVFKLIKHIGVGSEQVVWVWLLRCPNFYDHHKIVILEVANIFKWW